MGAVVEGGRVGGVPSPTGRRGAARAGGTVRHWCYYLFFCAWGIVGSIMRVFGFSLPALECFYRRKERVGLVLGAVLVRP